MGGREFALVPGLRPRAEKILTLAVSRTRARKDNVPARRRAGAGPRTNDVIMPESRRHVEPILELTSSRTREQTIG